MQLERREYDSLREEERGEKHAKERKWEMRKVDDDDSLCLSVRCISAFRLLVCACLVPGWTRVKLPSEVTADTRKSHKLRAIWRLIKFDFDKEKWKIWNWSRREKWPIIQIRKYFSSIRIKRCSKLEKQKSSHSIIHNAHNLFKSIFLAIKIDRIIIFNFEPISYTIFCALIIGICASGSCTFARLSASSCREKERIEKDWEDCNLQQQQQQPTSSCAALHVCLSSRQLFSSQPFASMPLCQLSIQMHLQQQQTILNFLSAKTAKSSAQLTKKMIIFRMKFLEK